MPTTAHRRSERLRTARLYLVCDARPAGRDPTGFLDAALAGGVDVVQLRDKTAADDDLLAAAALFRRACEDRGALFIVNDRPDLAVAADADGVHVGQDDVAVGDARASVGSERLVGVSTHTVEQVDAGARSGADYLAVGPVHPTPTKPTYPAVGHALVAHAARTVTLPWFAIGGIDATTVGGVAAAGAGRVVVVRALTEADDPAAGARALRRGLECPEAGVGIVQ
jgi:thiamine-phosphate pyrophosphorylase